jgi:hypothetical protein
MKLGENMDSREIASIECFTEKDLLHLIERNTEQTLYATRASAQLALYSTIGGLVGGAVAFFGWLALLSGNSQGTVLLGLGGFIAFGYVVVATLLSNLSLRRSRE